MKHEPLDTLDPYVTDRSEWTAADYIAEGAALVAQGRIAGHAGMKPHHDAAVARAYAGIAAPLSVARPLLSGTGA